VAVAPPTPSALPADDALLERGAALENQLAAIRSELVSLTASVGQERRKLRKSAIKLGFNAIIGTVGIAATPVTFVCHCV